MALLELGLLVDESVELQLQVMQWLLHRNRPLALFLTLLQNSFDELWKGELLSSLFRRRLQHCHLQRLAQDVPLFILLVDDLLDSSLSGPRTSI